MGGEISVSPDEALGPKASQSLGAAEAQIAALLTSQLSHKRPYLVTLATPIVGLAGIPDPDEI